MFLTRFFIDYKHVPTCRSISYIKLSGLEYPVYLANGTFKTDCLIAAFKSII